MSSLIESLESRVLMSAVPSVIALKAEGKVVFVDLVDVLKAGKSAFKLISADLKAAGELKSSATLLKTLVSDATAAGAVTVREVVGTERQIHADVSKLFAAAAPLRKHPANVTFQERVTAAADKLQADANADFSAITAAVTAANTTGKANLNALLAADAGNTKLVNDAADTIGPDGKAARQALANDVTIALTTDVTEVIDAFPA